MPNSNAIPSISLFGTRLDSISHSNALIRIVEMAYSGSGYVFFANVHMIMEARKRPRLTQGINRSQLVLPDGMPLAWLLRATINRNQERIAGPDFFPVLCRRLADRSLRIGIYGGTKTALQSCIFNLQAAIPQIDIAIAISPPFRKMTEAEDLTIINCINEANINVLFVALGCPKQEMWIIDHADKIQATMIGIGAALDYTAGTLSRAPQMLRSIGLEWLFRLICEPKRLAYRYLVLNTKFLWLLIFQARRSIKTKYAVEDSGL